jgi:hypothetical protein
LRRSKGGHDLEKCFAECVVWQITAGLGDELLRKVRPPSRAIVFAAATMAAWEYCVVLKSKPCVSSQTRPYGIRSFDPDPVFHEDNLDHRVLA